MVSRIWSGMFIFMMDFKPPSMKSRPTLILSAVVAALGGFLFGFDTAVISGTTHWLEDFFQLSKATLGFTVASAIIGTVAGSLMAGKPADIFGRRNVLFVLALLYLLSALGSAMASNWTMFLIYRFLGGIAVGGSSVVAPMYIAEITPARLRGRMVATVQVNVVSGMLIAYLSNYFIASLELGQVEWRWMFGVEAIPAFLFFVLLFFIPLSPRWLITKGKEDQAALVLEKCGTDNGNVGEEIVEIRRSLDMQTDHSKERFFSRKFRKPIMLAMAIAIFNQLSGINAVLYYAPHIFRMAGAGSNSALLQSVAIGGTFVVFTVLALTIIDRFGRKKVDDHWFPGVYHQPGCDCLGILYLWDRIQPGWGKGSADQYPDFCCIAFIRTGHCHMGFHQRGLSQSCQGKGPGPGKFYPLVYGCCHFLDISCYCRYFGWTYIRLLCHLHGGAIDLGNICHA